MCLINTVAEKAVDKNLNPHEGMYLDDNTTSKQGQNMVATNSTKLGTYCNKHACNNDYAIILYSNGYVIGAYIMCTLAR